ncbi:GNAT family N-acetyltransferase [Shewanella fidelis]|uniref:GNAT family N-acetyltransferase n=1 Tax=Shewanella fidelis TaxID=173509 RepID=A0AAW8NII3_9GAMM|nr:GNAT family N-acetyltransferase [Shewanella fidelis]MDR8523109.1 GNAT family N-acetyltransferase [Shewanella fidelis]MDW4811565.1 GNAT family N-acetyltransferase [Shewanella fidelis]MDW4815686.1 GNAT family N-acetyltransferase [Shewanella fidelis]MDW4819776.1 GNAT family N-acetyltransferase [Shewanella fidelis]MDW4824250.1 GNAT family N-acetyltransferase [Shewanella fidelis]
MDIIKATPADAALIAPLFDAYRVFYGQASNLALAEEFIAERLANNESVILLAVDSSGKALGFIQLYPSFSSVSAARIWVLNDLFVSDNARRQGVATQLMHAAKEFGIKTGVKGLVLETGVNNVNAQRLYESLGYIKDSGSYHYLLNL